MNSFYTANELEGLGLKSYGKNVFISRKSSIYDASKISIGNNVRIDDFAILSGQISIGSYVHISAYCCLYGREGIQIGNFCGMSIRSTIFSVTDDFSGNYMISPMIPDNLRNIITGKVIMEDHSQLGSNTTVMPNIRINEGAVTGAYSLVLKDLLAWSINFGIPAQFYKTRSQNAKSLSINIKV